MNRFKYPAADIEKAVRFLKKKKGQAPNFITKFPGEFTVKHGKLYAGNRRVIAAEKKDEFLRDVVYGKKSEYPFGRDSLFLLLKDEVLGVSKRDIEAFLNAQGPLVHRRSRPKKETRTNLRQIRKPGQLSIDLAHIKANDFERILGEEGYEYMGAPGKRGYQQDRYFLNAVDLLTGYLLTRVLQGKTPKEVEPKLRSIIDEYEKLLKQKVGRVETDKGGEFMGVVRKMLKEKNIRVFAKITNATVEQVNAKYQRIFYALVEQRRGGFDTTWKQAVRISNRTRNRRTGMTPEQALKKQAAGEKVTTKTPKARSTERKKAWKVGEKVRALKRPRAKADDLGYKAYKGEHFGAVTPITSVRFIGVYPKYKVGARWLWQDEVIKARPEDTKSHNLYIKRPVILPEKMRPKPKAKPKPSSRASRGPTKFYKHQDIWVTKHNTRFGAKITSIEGDKLKIEYYWRETNEEFTETILKTEAKPMRVYEIEDKVQIYDNVEKRWYNGEVDKHMKEGKYRVFYVNKTRKQVSDVVAGDRLRPKP